MLWLLPALQRDLGPLTGWAAFKRSIAAADEGHHAIIAEARAASVRRAARGARRLSMLSRRSTGRPAMSDQSCVTS